MKKAFLTVFLACAVYALASKGHADSSIHLTGIAAGFQPQGGGTPAPDDRPDLVAFSFPAVTNATAFQPASSNEALITGIDTEIPVTVTGDGAPMLRINSGVSVSSGTVSEGDLISVSLIPDDWEKTFSATVTAGSEQAVFSVTTGPEPITVALSTPPTSLAASQNVAFTTDLSPSASVSGGPKADPATIEDITWSVVSGALPAGLSLNASTGVLSGTPSAFGTFSFVVRAAIGSVQDEETYQIVVEKAPSWTVVGTVSSLSNSITLPASVQAGDLLVAVSAASSNRTGSTLAYPSVTTAYGTGFSAVNSVNSNWYFKISTTFYSYANVTALSTKIATGSDAGSTVTGFSSGTTSRNIVSVYVLRAASPVLTVSGASMVTRNIANTNLDPLTVASSADPETIKFYIYGGPNSSLSTDIVETPSADVQLNNLPGDWSGSGVDIVHIRSGLWFENEAASYTTDDGGSPSTRTYIGGHLNITRQ